MASPVGSEVARRRRRLAIALGSAAIGLMLLLPFAAGSVASGQPGRDGMAGLCHEVSTGFRGSLPPALGVATAGADLVAAFPPANFTCVDGGQGGDAKIFGVFTELADHSGTVAVLLAYDRTDSVGLHPSLAVEDEWKLYLREFFRDEQLMYADSDSDAGDGLIAWFVDHPMATVAQRLHNDSGRVEELTDLVSQVR